MAKLKLSKSSLQKERDNLKLYRRLLPSLDLKRRQLTVELEKARRQHEERKEAVDRLETRIGQEIPLMANGEVNLQGLVNMTGFQLGEENIVGTRLPILKKIQCQVVRYSFLTSPQWVDVVVDRLREAAEERIQVQVAAERVRILQQAVRRITQRVNLFDRILIPAARKNIQRIRIFLGDAERAAVVRSKITKKKQLQARSAATGGMAS